MIDFSNIPFKQAQWYTEVPVASPRHIQLIVLHCMDAPQKGNTAENVASYFANGSEGRPASAHYCIDNDSIVQCVQCKDVAFGAPNANHNGIHLEHPGFEDYTVAQWENEYGRAVLKNSALLCGKVLIPKFHIKPVFLKAQDLTTLGTKTGFTTHWEVTKAFNPGGHTDPGPNFPLDLYMVMVQQAVAGTLK